jgi:hypothetical protein
MFLLGYNRRLLWAALGAAAWAYLGIAAALAQAGPGRGGYGERGYGEPGQGPGDPAEGRGHGWSRHAYHEDGPGQGRGFGLQLRPPPGTVQLPGRVVEVREEGGRLHVTLEVKDEAQRVLRGAMGETLENGPPDVEIEYLTPVEAAGRQLTVSTAAGQTQPMRLPTGKQVVVGENWFVNLSGKNPVLVPHDGSGRRLLAEQRGFWREGEPRRPGELGPGGVGLEPPHDGRGERMDDRGHDGGKRWRWPWERDDDSVEQGGKARERGERGKGRPGGKGREHEGGNGKGRGQDDNHGDGKGGGGGQHPPQGPPPDEGGGPRPGPPPGGGGGGSEPPHGPPPRDGGGGGNAPPHGPPPGSGGGGGGNQPPQGAPPSGGGGGSRPPQGPAPGAR